MMTICCQFVVILTIISFAKCAERNLPPYIESCKQKDPELNKCIVDNANKAIPHIKDGDKKYKVIVFDPLRVNEAVIQAGNNLKLSMKNIDFIGLADSKFTEADANLKDGKIKIKLDVPRITITGDYEIEGRIVILPIMGQGKANITAIDCTLLLDINFKVEEKNGIKQFIIDNSVIDYTLQRSHYDFGNLFNGNVRLATEMQKFMDENWREVDGEFHGDLSLLIAEVFQHGLSQILQNVPYEKIFLP